MKPTLKTFIAIALPVQLLLVQWMGSDPQFVETYYSHGLYPVISQFLRRLLGWIPFSVGDVLYLVLFVLAGRYVYLHWKGIKKQPLRFGKDVLAGLSLVFFVFHSVWGMNYYRQPVRCPPGIEKAYTPEQLIAFTEYLIGKCNDYQSKLTTGDVMTPVELPYSKKEILKKTEEGYAALAQTFPDFAYETPSLKMSLFSIPLTYMGYGGYLNPFSNEAQVNGRLPLLRLPVVSGHEVAHQLGYAAEDATSFVGVLVTLRHTDVYFKYAAYHYALGHCLSRLKTVDKDQCEEMRALLHPGVQENFREIQRFWEKHKNVLEPLSKSVFNAFLNVNRQQEGLKSYGAVVGLLINYHNTYGL